MNVCKISKKCGGCQYSYMEYRQQLEKKHKAMTALLGSYGRVEPVIGMDNPYHYRNKVHAVFHRDKKGNVICGTYEQGTHHVLSVDECLIEDKKSQEIIRTVKKLAVSFKLQIFDEDTGRGLLRHALVRRGFSTGEIMVVLVLSSPVMPSKKNFVKALLKEHPEITTIILNVNSKKTSMVLGDKEEVIYGSGYIKDELCGCMFRISSKSFYQVNPVQTHTLYMKAMEYADLKGKERVIDAYCGIGTIGMVAAKTAGSVIGVELEPAAVRDARTNAKYNGINNIEFRQGDAGEFMVQMAAKGEKADVVFMDPPRAGSSQRFLKSLVTLAPKKVVYISCGPDTLARDLKYLVSNGYKVEKLQPVDMFPLTEHCEVVCLLSRKA